MDSLVVLDRGRIVEQGTHEHLLALGGIYASLWSHQSGGFLPATVPPDLDQRLGLASKPIATR
jgi:ATP-binding cassette subfamily B multidrug efflux pump